MTEEIGREIAKIRNRLMELSTAVRSEGTGGEGELEPDLQSSKKLKWAASILKGLSVND